MMKMEEVLIDEFFVGNEGGYEIDERVECFYCDEEYSDEDNYDDEDIEMWNDLKDRLRKGSLVVSKEYGVFNFELVGEDVLMWLINKF
jgi:hypothetical protein